MDTSIHTSTKIRINLWIIMIAPQISKGEAVNILVAVEYSNILGANHHRLLIFHSCIPTIRIKKAQNNECFP